MFHFQVFRRAKAKTFPVDGKEIKRIQRERKRKAKEERKKKENESTKKSKLWLMRMR